VARTRTIKPEFWDDEKLAVNCCRDARLLYVGMWCHSDDYGVVKGNPVWLKSKIFPYDNIKIESFKAWLKDLQNICVIIPFLANDENYFFIKNFLKYQSINRPSQMRNPPPPENINEALTEHSLSTHGALMSETETETETETKTETETEEIFLSLFNFWNSKKIIQHKKLTDKTRTKIRSALKDYSEQEIREAIENYAIITQQAGTKYFWPKNQKWTLAEFLQRGLERFLNTANPLKNFLLSADKQRGTNDNEERFEDQDYYEGIPEYLRK